MHVLQRMLELGAFSPLLSYVVKNTAVQYIYDGSQSGIQIGVREDEETGQREDYIVYGIVDCCVCENNWELTNGVEWNCGIIIWNNGWSGKCKEIMMKD